MSKAVLISIRPEWCERIASKLKTVEVRKSRPKIKPPFKCYIYCTKFKYGEILCFPQQKTGKVIGEFVCDEVEEFAANPRTTHLIQTERIARASNLGMEALVVYGLHSPRLYSWHISDLAILFRTVGTDKTGSARASPRLTARFRSETTIPTGA